MKLQHAQDILRTELERLLGPGLDGVSGVGSGLSPSGSGVGLTVITDGHGTISDTLRQALPDTIAGVPVYVSARGAGRLE